MEFRIGDHGLAREDPANEEAATVGPEERYWSPLDQARGLDDEYVQAVFVRSRSFARYRREDLLDAFHVGRDPDGQSWKENQALDWRTWRLPRAFR